MVEKLSKITIPKTEERLKIYHEAERLWGERTTTKAIDASCELAVNMLRDITAVMTKPQARLVIPERYWDTLRIR